MNKKTVNLLLSLIIVISVSINLFWIFNYSNPINSEDMVQLEPVIKLIKNEPLQSNNELNLFSKTKSNFIKIYISNFQPIIPFIYYLGSKIYWHPFSPLIVNLFFSVILILFSYLIGKELFNEKSGLLAALMVAFSQSILSYQRSIYDAFILITLFTINVFLFLKSNNFNKLSWSILWAISASICILSRYTQIIYIIFILLFSFITSFSTHNNYKNNLTKLLVFKKFLIPILIILIFVLPHYILGKNVVDLSNNFFLRNIKKSNFEASSFFEFLIYPFFLINFQLGIFYFIMFIISSIVYLKTKKKKVNILLILFQIISSLMFFSFIHLKNNVITSMTIPLMLIFISGSIFNIKNKTIKKFIAIIIIIYSLLIILPLELPDKINNFTNSSKISSNQIKESMYYLFNSEFKIINKDHFLVSSYNLLKYTKKTNYINDTLKILINSSNKKDISILDLSTNLNEELQYYNLFLKYPINIDYTFGRLIKNKTTNLSKLNYYDFIILSEKNHSTIDYINLPSYELSLLDILKQKIINSTSFVFIKKFPNFRNNESNQLYIYKKVKNT
jgi:uncharacterized membrane protein